MTPLVLIHPHTHASKTYQAGERIVVDPDLAQWLIREGVARPEEEQTRTPSLVSETLSKPPRRNNL